MPRVVAWLEDADRSGVATDIAAVADNNQAVQVTGDNLRLPPGFPFVYFAYGWTEFAAFPVDRLTISQASIGQNPLLINNGVNLTPSNEGQYYDWRGGAYRFNTGEDTTVNGFETDEAGVSHFLGFVAFVSKSPVVPSMRYPTLPITHVHNCTIGATTAAVWSNLALVEVNALPAGKYICQGARVASATAVAARLVFDNIDDRPPITPVTRSQDFLHPISSYWGTDRFQFVIPDGLPSIDMLTSTAETPSEIELYLTKIA